MQYAGIVQVACVFVLVIHDAGHGGLTVAGNGVVYDESVTKLQVRNV